MIPRRFFGALLLGVGLLGSVIWFFSNVPGGNLLLLIDYLTDYHRFWETVIGGQGFFWTLILSGTLLIAAVTTVVGLIQSPTYGSRAIGCGWGCLSAVVIFFLVVGRTLIINGIFSDGTFNAAVAAILMGILYGACITVGVYVGVGIAGFLDDPTIGWAAGVIALLLAIPTQLMRTPAPTPLDGTMQALQQHGTAQSITLTQYSVTLTFQVIAEGTIAAMRGTQTALQTTATAIMGLPTQEETSTPSITHSKMTIAPEINKKVQMTATPLGHNVPVISQTEANLAESVINILRDPVFQGLGCISGLIVGVIGLFISARANRR